jgi:hypothetical protein
MTTKQTPSREQGEFVMGAAAYNRGSRAIRASFDRDARRRPCPGTYRNGPNKDFARCSYCGRVDYEKYEGDRCTVTLVER